MVESDIDKEGIAPPDVDDTGSGARSLRNLSEDLERSRGDVTQLERLRDELGAQKSKKETGVLRLKVISALLAARKRPADAVSQPRQVTPRRAAEAVPVRPHDLTAFLRARHLTAPDQRCLYLYRVSDEEMSELRTALEYHAKSGRLDRPTNVISAQFVLFAAEWFRRSFAGGSYAWDGIVTDIAATLSPEERSILVEHGLAWWGRELRRSVARRRQFLLSCVLEGGFPTRLLESREHGWLGVHLRRLVNLATTMGEPRRAEALSGHVMRDLSVPESFRNDEFCTLCVNLAIAIADLRHEVQGMPATAGDRPSFRLDRRRPEWRQDLPLVIEGSGAERLVDDLLSASIETFGGSEARCWRLLVRADDSWHSALRLSADGPISLPPTLTVGTARLRVTPVGRLADDITGEIALLDPPGAAGPWLARARPAAPRSPIGGYPLNAAVDVELRCENDVIGRVRWKGGDPLRSDVLTFFDEGGGGGVGRILNFVGSGSCRARQSPLYVLASARHLARTADGNQIAAEWTGELGQLFRLDGVTYVGVRGEDELFYKIEPNAAAERTQSLGLDGASVKGLTGIDGDDVYAGPPTILKITAGTRTDTRKTPNEVYWRHLNRAQWHDIACRNIEPGAIELVWKDPQSRVAHDRRRLIVLPTGTKLHAVGLPAARASFTLEQAGPWMLSTAESPGVTVEHQGPSLHIGWAGTPRRSIELRLDALGHAGLVVRAPFPLRNAFVSADGGLLPSDAVVTLDQLRGARAIVGSYGELRVEPRGGNTRWSRIERFWLEYPLWSLRDELEGLLSEAGDLDAEVVLTIQPGGGRLRVRRYEMRFRRPEATAAKLERSLPTGLHDIEYKWRSLIDMGDFGGRNLAPLERGEHGCDLPSDLSGPGVVYACRAGALAVRPTLVDRPLVPGNGSTPLQAAVLITGWSFRSKAIGDRLNAIAAGAPDADADLAWMHALLGVPDGLPPATFEVLQALPSCPGAASALVFSASDEAACERVWRLEQALPFLWVLCRVDAWRSAYDAAIQRRSIRLRMAGFAEEEAAEMARSGLAHLIDRMLQFDESLLAVFRFAGLGARQGEPVRDAHEIAQDRIRRSADRQDTATPTSCFNFAFLGGDMQHHLTPWRFAFDQSQWQGLDAPVFAALAAAGRITPTGEQRLAMRQARREDAQHFSEAYAAALGSLV